MPGYRRKNILLLNYEIIFTKGVSFGIPTLKSPQDFFDIAAATQALYEDIFREILACVSVSINSTNLVLGGGCSLNCVANSIAFDYFNDVWIFPSPGDSGSSLGSVLGLFKSHIDWESPFLGYKIDRNLAVDNIVNCLKKKVFVGLLTVRPNLVLEPLEIEAC